MSEAIVTPVLASTTVTEEARDLQLALRQFYERHHTPIVIVGVIIAGAVLNRSIIRRELKRLHFAVEVIADGDLVDLSQYEYLDND